MAEAIADAIMGSYSKKDGYFESPGYLCTWAQGHLLQLAEPESYDPKYKQWSLDHLPIIPVKYKLDQNPKTLDRLRTIKSLLPRCTSVVNACDSAREGQYIFGNIEQHLQIINKPVKRLWTSSVTKEALQQAWANMKDDREYRNLLIAGKARAAADWVIGINSTRAFTTKHNETLTLGRVQTPLLAMLLDHQNNIENFVVETYYQVQGTFGTGSESYTGIWQGPRLTDKVAAEQIAQSIKGKIGIVTHYEKKVTKANPPILFSLSLLQREASKKYGFEGSYTLELIQSLYEKKVLTYPRTSSSYVDETNIPEMHKAFDALLQTPYQQNMSGADKAWVSTSNKNVCNPKEIEDHHAILPTHIIPTSFESEDHRLIYDLIVRRFISHFFPPAEYIQYTILTEVNQEPFKSSIKELKDLGWKQVYADWKKPKEESEEEELKRGVQLTQNQQVFCLQGDTIPKETTPPKWYLEGEIPYIMKTLGKDIEDPEMRALMRDKGLGTEATRSGIVNQLKEKGYIYIEKNKVKVSQKGKQLIELVRSSGINILTSVTMTAEWEKELNLIAKGNTSPARFVDSVNKLVQYIVQQVKAQAAAPATFFKQTIGLCPACKNDLVESRYSYRCSDTSCSVNIPKEKGGKKLSAKNISDLITKGKTSVLTFKKKDESGTYDAALILKTDYTIGFEYANTNSGKGKAGSRSQGSSKSRSTSSYKKNGA